MELCQISYFVLFIILLDSTFASISYEDEIVKLMTAVGRQENELKELRLKNQKMEYHFERQIVKLRLENELLKKTSDDQNKEILKLKAQVLNLETNLSNIPLQNNIGNHSDRRGPSSIMNRGSNAGNIVKSNLSALPFCGHKRESAPAESVAFYAVMSQSQHNPSAHHLLIFDDLRTNEGNGYNNFSGTFTAPVAGLYVFCITIYARGEADTLFEILKNTAIIGSIYSETNDYPGDNDLDTAIIVYSVEKGENIFIRTSYAHGGEILGGLTHPSSFSGWKIN